MYVDSDEYDSEYVKLCMAAECKTKKTHGFQGCKNYPRDCDFGGFYLATYSDEGLCDDCEFKSYPERWNGCLHCGLAIKFDSICYRCESGLHAWLNIVFDCSSFTWPNSHRLELAIHSILSHYTAIELRNTPIRFFERSKVIPRSNKALKENCQFNEIKNNDHGSYLHEEQWPGFHIGKNKNIVPDPFKLRELVNIRDTEVEISGTVLIRELEKHNVFLYKLVQYILPFPVQENKRRKRNGRTKHSKK